jgi:hypothetical protein
MQNMLRDQKAYNAINPMRGTQGVTLMHFLANRGGCLGAAALCLLMFCNIAPSAVPDSETEAALIYKIGKFVRWPEASFAAQGGMVGFSTTDGRVNIEINSGASKRAGLDIGSQLLQRATLVADVRLSVKP